MGGPALALDALGPIVIGSDGSTSRILGWAEKMAEEQELALRLVGKRNAKRLAALAAAAEGAQAPP